MTWSWIGFGMLILGGGLILWGLIRFFIFVDDENDD